MGLSLRIILLLVWPLYLNDIYRIAIGDAHLTYLWILDVLFSVIIPLATLYVLFQKKQIFLFEMGLDKLPRLKPIIFIFGVSMLLVIPMNYVYFQLTRLMPWHLIEEYHFPEREPFHSIMIIYAALSAGILEEIVYRGVIISQLRKHIMSDYKVVLISGAIFSGIHWSEGPAKLLFTFIVGIILSIWFIRRRSLWGLITFHTSYLIFSQYIGKFLNLLSYFGIL